MINVIVYSLIGGVISLVGGVILLSSRRSAELLAINATPFAAGVLLAAAFTDLLPDALHDQEVKSIMITTLCGVLGFFILERFLRFFHHHHEDELNNQASNSLIIIGDTLHNALDGVAIGAAFLISPSTGIVTAIAVAAHEIPQEIGDFGLLLRNGMNPSKVLLVNIVSALATLLAAVAVFSIGTANLSFVPYLLALTAGFFIYIAASDIIPEIHEKKHSSTGIDWRPWLLILGSLFVLIVSPIMHEYIDVGKVDHDHQQSGVHLD